MIARRPPKGYHTRFLMALAMTFSANRNHIKPMLWGITKEMMVFLGWFYATGTRIVSCWIHLAITYRVINCLPGSHTVRMQCDLMCPASLPFFACIISCHNSFAFISFSVTRLAGTALRCFFVTCFSGPLTALTTFCVHFLFPVIVLKSQVLEPRPVQDYRFSGMTLSAPVNS